ncbi:MAG: UDP-N-acetylmuramoyl-tripeptide--D-alanyl-D-alanine ligase [Clostridia bacterium]
MEFFSLSNPHLFIALILSVFNGVLMCFAGYKFLQMIQLSSYKLSGYFLWLKSDRAKFASRLFMLSFLSSACILVTNALFSAYKENQYFSYIGIIFYFYFTIVFTKKMYEAPKKVPLKQTRRMSRLCVMLFLAISVISFYLIAFSSIILPLYKFGSICLTPLLLIILVPIVHLIMVPFENLNHARYICKAKNKLKKLPNLIKIGITGSYGKTSCKNILNVILSQKYQVCISPHSFNTPMGLTKVVLDYLKPNHEVLIAEMGARQRGEIATLCKLINPQHGILTSVGTQHLLSFGSEENIAQGKFELIESLPNQGKAVFNMDNEKSMPLFEKCTNQKFLVSLENPKANCYAKNVIVNNEGSNFTLVIGEEEKQCKTSLLGKHNLLNILLCSCFARQLGLEMEQIANAISLLKPVAHRLELIKQNELIILDDSYNASVEGVKAALEVLNSFDSKNKIVVTPGLIELGILEEIENENFGKQIAKVASKVIVVNKTNLSSIKKGLISAEFDENNIFEAETLDHAQIILSSIAEPKSVILFENDLPDNYI